MALVQLEQAPCADPARRELRAEVRPALIGLAHLRAQLRDRLLVEHARANDDALVVERGAVGGHRSGRRAADVRVVRAAGRERDQVGSAAADPIGESLGGRFSGE